MGHVKLTQSISQKRTMVTTDALFSVVLVEGVDVGHGSTKWKTAPARWTGFAAVLSGCVSFVEMQVDVVFVLFHFSCECCLGFLDVLQAPEP